MKSILILTVLVILRGATLFSDVVAQEESSSAPKISTFATGKDILGVASNSVNLFSGDVHLPLALLSVPGRNGLDVGVNISYNSNIQNQNSTWNLEAPTGIMGLGWSFGYEKIIVNHKSTGSIRDDDYYHISGSAGNQLIRTGTAPDGRLIYELKNYQFWKIRRDTTYDWWEITKEDGTVFRFGGGVYSYNNRKYSEGNSVQWSVKWGNWVGSGTQDSLQRQFATAWNLSKIKNISGDSVRFEYLNVDTTVKAGKPHTEASYLRRIIDVYGRRVEFILSDKLYNPSGQKEYQDPTTRFAEPDPYQDYYERKFLDSIEVFNDLNEKLMCIDLDYVILGSDSLAKRYLTSIIQRNAAYQSLPGIKFEYHTTGSLPGALKRITTPLGAKVEYTYTTVNIKNSHRDLTVVRPQNCHNARVWTGDDYILVTWINNSDDSIKVAAYVWEGRWVSSGILATIGNVDYSLSQGYDFEAVIEKDFFGILINYNRSSSTKYLHLFHKKPNAPDKWDYYTQSLNVVNIQDNDVTFFSGERYVVVFGEESGKLFRYTWNGTSWSSIEGPQLDSGTEDDFFGTGAPDYFIFHDQNEGALDSIKFYYLDELGNWNIKLLNPTYSFDTDGGGDNETYWYAGPNFCVAMIEGQDDRIYWWSEEFDINQPHDTIVGVEFNSKVYINDAQISIHNMTSDHKDKVRLYRFDGQKWIDKSLDNTSTHLYSATSSFGADLAIRGSIQSEPAKIAEYNPSSGQWEERGLPNGGPRVGSRYYVYPNHDSIFYKIPNGQWRFAGKVSGNNTAGLRHGLNFTTSTHDSVPTKTGRAFILKNGQLKTTYISPYHTYNQYSSGILPNSDLTGAFACVFSTSSFDTLVLHRVVGDAMTGRQQDFPVSSVTVYSGMDTTTVTYTYNDCTATYDPSGNFAEYHEVKSTPSGGISGYTTTYFINSLRDTVTGFNISYLDQEMKDNIGFLKGMQYYEQIYNASGTATGNTSQKYAITLKTLGAKAAGYYVRPKESISSRYGVTASTTYSYNVSNGLVAQTTTSNRDASGNTDNIVKTFKYFYEAYDTTRTLNLLTPVIQTKDWVNNSVVATATTIWKDWGGLRWAPYKSFVYQGIGSTDFNFSSYSGASDPPATEWIKINEIVSRIGGGPVKQSKNADGVVSSFVYDYPYLNPIASFVNARISDTTLGSESSFLSFESNNEASGIKENDYWSFNASNDFSTDAHSGVYSRKILPGSNVKGPSREFMPPDIKGQNRKYVFSCWVKTQSGFGSNNGRLVIHSKRNTDTAKTVYPNVPGAIATIYISDTQGQWKYIEAMIDLGKVRTDGGIGSGELLRLRDTISNNDATKYFLVDDIRFSPYDSPFSGIAYEKTYGLPVASVGSNGEFSKTMYDRFQRNIGTIVNDQFVPGTQMMYYSRKGNADTLNINDLNTSVSVTASGAGKMDDFADGTADGWSLGTGVWTVTGGELTCTGSGANDYATLTGTGSTGVRAKVRSVNGGENYGIQIGNVLFARYSGAWKITIGSYSQMTSAMPSGTDWLAIVRDSVSLLYVDGKQIFNVRKWNTGGNVSFYVGSFNTVAGFDDFIMFRDPGVALSYLDGSGKVVQSQFLDSVGTVVTATLYDPLNRDAVVTKSAKYDSMFAYRRSLVSGFNWSSGIMTGYITTTGNAGSYPYSRLKFEDSPLSGVIESSAPGDTFRIGRKTVKSAYGSNVTGDGFRDDLPAGQYYMETSVDADGDSSWSLTDQSGKVISRRSGSVFGRALLDSTADVEFPEEIDTEPSLKQFTATVNQTCSYTCYLSGGVGGVPSKSRTAYFKIGTTFGGSDIVSHSKTGNPGQNFSGTFTAQAGVTYYVEVSGYVDVSIASGAVMYKSFGDGMYYPQTSYEYDDAGNLTCVYTPNYFIPPSGTALTDTNFIIRFQYDYMGRLLSRKSPDGGTTRYMYDRLGRLRFSVNANGDAASPDIISYIKYDTYGRKTEEGYYAYNWSGLTQTLADSASWPAPTTWRKKYSFDGDTSKPYMIGRLQKLQTNNDGDSTLEVEESYTYDIFGRMTSKSLNVADFDATLYTSSYAYDFAGNVTQMTYPSTGTQIRYSYNGSGALVAIGTPSDSDYFAGYRYYPDGALKEERLNNNTIIRSFTYNSAGWLTKIDDNYFREDIDYIANGYGGAGYFDGNISRTFYKYKWLPDSMTYQYKYDKFGRLLVADNSVSSNWDMGVGQETVFDANGNIVKMKYGALAKTYAYYTGTNKIKNTDGSGNDYVYDNIGNVTKSTPKMIDSLFYDPFINRTKQISKSTSKMTFQYDGTERRVYKKDSTSAISREFLYLYDGLNAVAVKRKGGGTSEYVYGPTGLIAANINGTWYFVLKDHLGSARTIVDQSGTTKASIDYAPYGAIIRTSGSPNIAYQFTGQEYDSTSGLWNYKARMYDAELGVFYAVDPAGQFAGAYIGLGNNPVNGTDPTGTVFGIDDVIFLAMVVASMEYADKFSQGKDGRSAFGLGFVKGFAQGVIFGAPDPLTVISSVAVSRFVPDKKVGPVRISPVFAFGSEGYTGGVNVSLEGNIGNVRGSVGAGLAYTGSTGQNSNHTEGLFARGNVTAGVGKHNWVAVGLARYQGISGTDPDFNQSLFQFNTYLSDAGGFAFNWSNDLPFSDRGRTASAEVGFGRHLLGFNVYTSERGDPTKALESAKNGSAYVSEFHGVNEKGSYNDRGTPYFSAFYFARRSGRNVFRAGVNATWVQDLFQNGAHQLIGVPYFIPSNYSSRPYGYFGRYNPYIY